MATYSDTAIRKHINNQFNDTTFRNACRCGKLLVDVIVESYKNYGSKLILTSMLRVPELNETVGGSKTSRHCFGDAADINIKGITQKQLFNDIISGKIKNKDNIPLKNIIDQVIYEGTWVHVALNSSSAKPRNMFLVAHFTPNGVSYTEVCNEI